MLTSAGVFHLTARGVHTHVLQHHELHHLSTGDAVAIYYDRHGVLWIGLRDGLVRLTPDPTKSGAEYTQEVVPGFKNEVTALVGDYRGDMWVGTYNEGLCRVSGSRFSCWTTKDGLADDSVRSLFEDDEHNLWLAWLVVA